VSPEDLKVSELRKEDKELISRLEAEYAEQLERLKPKIENEQKNDDTIDTRRVEASSSHHSAPKPVTKKFIAKQTVGTYRNMYSVLCVRANSTMVFKPWLCAFKPIKRTDSSLNLG